jgi:hypothetical protein
MQFWQLERVLLENDLWSLYFMAPLTHLDTLNTLEAKLGQQVKATDPCPRSQQVLEPNCYP